MEFRSRKSFPTRIRLLLKLRRDLRILTGKDRESTSLTFGAAPPPLFE